MPDQVEKLLNLEAEHHVDIDKMVADKETQYSTRFSELLRVTVGRDQEVFELIGANPELTVDDFEATPIWDRNLDTNWQGEFSKVFTACVMQAWAEIFGADALETFERNGQRINKQSTSMDNSELDKAARQGISKARIAEMKVAKHGAS